MLFIKKKKKKNGGRIETKKRLFGGEEDKLEDERKIEWKSKKNGKNNLSAYKTKKKKYGQNNRV